jgi:hypothetical protein
MRKEITFGIEDSKNMPVSHLRNGRVMTSGIEIACFDVMPELMISVLNSRGDIASGEIRLPADARVAREVAAIFTEFADQMENRNTEIHYMYRDCSNYKQAASFVVAGRVSLEDLLDCCANEIGDNNDFLPGQVCLDALQSRMCNGVDSEQDGVWHELTDADPTGADPTTEITAAQLLKNFRACKGKWNEAKEMEAVGL